MEQRTMSRRIIGQKAYIKDNVDSIHAGGWGIVEYKDAYGLYHLSMYGDYNYCVCFARNEFVVHYKKGKKGMSVAEQVRDLQDLKEMTRRAILVLKSLGQDVSDLEAEFFEAYHEEAIPTRKEEQK